VHTQPYAAINNLTPGPTVGDVGDACAFVAAAPLRSANPKQAVGQGKILNGVDHYSFCSETTPLGG
jgi:hypothetical protein